MGEMGECDPCLQWQAEVSGDSGLITWKEGDLTKDSWGPKMAQWASQKEVYESRRRLHQQRIRKGCWRRNERTQKAGPGPPAPPANSALRLPSGLCRL
jgi:hypothetical protein